MVDVFALSSPRLNASVRRAYLGAINRTPRLWRVLYALMDEPFLMNVGLWALRSQSRMLDEVIERERPAAICSSFPAYAALLQRLRRRGRCAMPHFNIVTDSISINSVWWRPGCDGWFVPNEDTAEVMRAGRRSIPRACMSYGVPGDSPISGKERGDRDAARTCRGARHPRVLYIINSGTHNAEATARLLARRGRLGSHRCIRRARRGPARHPLLARGLGPSSSREPTSSAGRTGYPSSS